MTITLNGTTGIVGPNGTASVPAMTGVDTDSGIVYGTNTVQIATGGATAVTVDSSQNVGIGTSSPQARLHAATSSAEIARYQSSSANGGFQIFYPDNGTTPVYIGSQKAILASGNASDFAIIGTGSNNMVFGTASAERMRIDSSGNFMLGTTSAGGVGGFTFYPLGASSSALLVSNRSGTGTIFSFQINTTQIGSIQANVSSTTYATTSDYRLKENIAPMTDALAKVAQLKPVTYTWKADSSEGQGFIAHELQEVVPDAVVGEKDAVDAEGNPVYQGIDTSFLVATLTAAIQELNAKVTALEAQLGAK